MAQTTTKTAKAGTPVKTKQSAYVIQKTSGIGTVKVSNEVVMAIAAVAAMEVKGVFAMQGNAAREIVTMLGFKSLSQGVSIQYNTGDCKITVGIILDYGYSIPKVSALVQEKVKSSVENMTGLDVSCVNVRIAGVNINE